MTVKENINNDHEHEKRSQNNYNYRSAEFVKTFHSLLFLNVFDISFVKTYRGNNNVKSCIIKIKHREAPCTPEYKARHCLALLTKIST